jgi:hypothetical protein
MHTSCILSRDNFRVMITLGIYIPRQLKHITRAKLYTYAATFASFWKNKNLASRYFNLVYVKGYSSIDFHNTPSYFKRSSSSPSIYILTNNPHKRQYL